MNNPNFSEWNQFEVKRDQFTEEAQNARLVNEEKSRGSEAAENQSGPLSWLAAVVRFLLHPRRHAHVRPHAISSVGH